MKKATDLRRYEHQSVVEFRAVFEMLRRINKCAPQVRNDLWRFRLFSGCRGKIQAAAMEVDRVDEVLFVAGAAGRVLHLLDPGISGSRGQWLSVFLRDWEDYGYQEAWSGIYRPHFTVMDVNRAPCDGQS